MCVLLSSRSKKESYRSKRKWGWHWDFLPFCKSEDFPPPSWIWLKDYFPHNYQSWKRIPDKSKSKLITRLSGYALYFKFIIYKIQLSRGRSQGFEPFSHNWQEPVIANSFPLSIDRAPRTGLEYTFFCASSLLFTSDRSRASLSLVFEVGERAGPGHAFTPTAARGSIIIVFPEKGSWKLELYETSCFQSIRVGRASSGNLSKGVLADRPPFHSVACGEGNWKQIKTMNRRGQ